MIIMELTTVTQPNKSLDASGGSVFLNLLGTAEGAPPILTSGRCLMTRAQDRLPFS
jgi:hypothetical protein